MQREPTACPVCGKDVEQAETGRGRPREYHQVCRTLRNALDEMARNLECVEFGGLDDARAFANELFCQYNVAHQAFMKLRREALSNADP